MKYTIVGQKGVLIQLDKFPEEMTQTASGIVIPQYKAYETEGGRPAAKIDEEVYSTVGTILQISTRAQEDIDKDSLDFQVGDKVMINAAAKSQHNWFLDQPYQRVQDYTGKLLISPYQVLAKVEE